MVPPRPEARLSFLVRPNKHTMGVLTDILKEIPLSAVLKERLAAAEDRMGTLEKETATLKNENTHLRLENANLRQQVQKLQPVAHALSEDQVRILQLLDKARENIPVVKVAANLSVDVARVEYLIIKLREEEYILHVPTGLRLTDKGRKLVHESLT